MKIRSSIKKTCEKCRMIRRYEITIVICQNQKHKQRQGLKIFLSTVLFILILMPISTPNTFNRGKIRKQKIHEGIAYIHASFNNTIVIMVTTKGMILAWISAGACGFGGIRKNTPFAAKITSEIVAKKCLDQGIREVSVYIFGPGPGREIAIRRMNESGLHVIFIREVTSLPHNGCRAPKRRRVLLLLL